MQRLQDVYVAVDRDRDRIRASIESGCWVSTRNGNIILTAATPAPNQYRVTLELTSRQASWLAAALGDCASNETPR